MLKNKIDIAIINVCTNVISEPLITFSEADLQLLLAEELRKIPIIKKLHATSVNRGKDSETQYKTSLLHREYGGGKNTRIDIVIFDPKDVESIEKTNLVNQDGNYLKPKYAFEMGTEKSRDIGNHFINDIKKLEDVVKPDGTGYIIHIQKDVTVSKSGTGRRIKTEGKVNIFKNVFKVQKLPDGIKVIAILLRTARQQKRMRNKCEIFNGKDFQAININSKEKINKIILSQLK